MRQVLHETIPITEKDCFYIVERHKSEFTYPLHCHRDFELNFVENAEGAVRVVGDNVEQIGQYDLVLIGGENLEHAWKQGSCPMDRDIREITIQFSADLFTENLLSRNQFVSIKRMLERSRHGLAFSLHSIMVVYDLLDRLAKVTEPFAQFINFLQLLYKLSLSLEAKELAGSGFAYSERAQEEDRVMLVRQYIEEHFAENPSLGELAAMVYMTPSAFSRYFKARTGSTLSDYIIDVKLSYASRLLVDTTRTIAEVCYECGFNNQSNFNRIFKAKKGQTPREFRATFKKTKTIV